MPRFGSFRTAQYLFESRLRYPHLKENRMHRNRIISLKVFNKPAFAGIVSAVFSTAAVVGSHYYLASTFSKKHEDLDQRLSVFERHADRVAEYWDAVDAAQERGNTLCEALRSPEVARKLEDIKNPTTSIK